MQAHKTAHFAGHNETRAQLTFPPDHQPARYGFYFPSFRRQGLTGALAALQQQHAVNTRTITGIFSSLQHGNVGVAPRGKPVYILPGFGRRVYS